MPKRKVDEVDGELQITLSENRSESPNKSLKLDNNTEKENAVNSSDLNLSSTLDKTIVNFDKTLPPGAAPEGFVLLDEDIDTSKNSDINQTKKKTRNSPTREPEPVMKVTFKDDSIARRYRHSIEDCLKRLVRGRNYIRFDGGKLVLKIFDTDPDKNRASSRSRDKTRQRESSPSRRKEREIRSGKDTSKDKSKESSQNLFTIDTAPQLPDDYDIPVYGRKFNKTLEDSVDETFEGKEELAPKQTCFNCLGNHSLRDCEKPRNFHEISKNRKNFNAKKGLSTNRYHLEDDQRFGHHIPGVLSLNLRKALGLRDNELPPFIYRMRDIGYPPGWLEEARLQHSGLSLFNSEGVAEAGCSDEEGEIIAPGDKDQYDIKKLIDFPGFNVETPLGIRDDWKSYWGSQSQLENSKAAMLQFYSLKKAKEGYTRKKLVNTSKIFVNSNVNSGEMEIDEVEETPVENVPVKDLFIPPLPQIDAQGDAPPPPPISTAISLTRSKSPLCITLSDSPTKLSPEKKVKEQKSSGNNSSSSSSSSGSDNSSNENSSDSENGEEELPAAGSPSLVDLEIAKKRILDALGEGGSATVKNKMAEAAGDNNLASLETKTDKTEINVDDTSKEAEKLSAITPSEVEKVKTPQAVERSSSKFVTEGTPILKSVSPYSRLPTSEKFSKNICDVINFENLPDYTGKYDKMVGLLQKVRKTMSKLSNE